MNLNRDSCSSPKSGSLNRVLLSQKEAKTLVRRKRFLGELVGEVVDFFTGEREDEEESWEDYRVARRRRYYSCAAHA